MKRLLNRFQYWLFFKTFIFSTVIISIIFFIGGILFYKLSLASYEEEVKIEQRVEALALQNILQIYVDNIKSDISILANTPLVTKYILNSSKENKYDLYETSKNIIEKSEYYYQLRILSLSGYELFRMDHKNGKAIVVPDKSLQNKSNRYYYKQALRLKKGQIVVSDYDYNIENGKIERPIKPTFRLITPVYKNDKKLAYLVINFDDDILKKEFETFNRATGFEIYLLNNQKQFLFYKSSSSELDKINKQSLSYAKLIDNSFDSKEFFDLNNSFYYKLRFPLQVGVDSNNKFLVLLIENPKKQYFLFRDRIWNRVIFSTIILWIVVLIIFLTIIFLYFIFSISLRKLSKTLKLLELSDEGVVMTDEKGIINYVNPAFMKMFMCSEKETIGYNISKFKSNYHDKDFYTAMWNRIDSTGKWEGDILDILTDGTKKIKHLRIEKIVDKRVDKIFFMGLYKDVTKLRNSENAIKQLINSDYLTALPNKKSAIEQVEKIIRSCTKSFSRLASN